jgi:acetoin utilization protein AcuB
MRATDWMTIEPTTVTPADTVRDARRIMRLRGVRHLPVVDGARVVGMLSDRDVRITDAQIDEIAGPDDLARLVAHERTVAEAMSSPVHVLRTDATIDDAARLMLSRRISAAPVVDDEGSLAGLITTTDCLLAFLSPHHDPT